ncbi:topless-related protein 4-like [Bidens hawaiensis]|uniref:topless-related protein 4-like n=1 Tax=Bidens hawaiensis TaxID=980011 RepID=UPI00404B59FC
MAHPLDSFMNNIVPYKLNSIDRFGGLRQNEQLRTYIDNKTERAKLVQELKNLYEANPELHEKRKFPTMDHGRLRLLVNQGLNWQHKLCNNPSPDPDITTLFEDHVCEPSQVVPAPAPAPEQASVANNQIMRPIPRRAAFLHPEFHPTEPSLFLHASSSQGSGNPLSLTPVPASRVLVRATHNTGLDTQLHTRRTRHFEMLDEARDIPTSSTACPAAQNHLLNSLPTDDVPNNVISVINQGSEVKTMDFHPKYQTLLAVGTNTGDVTIWEIASQLQIAHKQFNVWDIGAYIIPLQFFLNNECLTMVNRVMWSPDGRFLGVAYSKHIIQIYSFRIGHDLEQHIEIEAHDGYVSDLAFTVRNQSLIVITCGEDRLVKVWYAETGACLYIFAGHEAPVSFVCPHVKENIEFIFSTSIDGKIKAWFYDDPLSKIDFETPGFVSTRMANNGTRLLSSCSRGMKSFLVEWNDSERNVTRIYKGIGKNSAIVPFDTAGRFLAAGDEYCIKFWDLDDEHILCRTYADGGLLASPCLRFSKDVTLLAVSTYSHGVKILGNEEGIQLAESIKDHPVEALKLASEKASKHAEQASIVTAAGVNINVATSSSAGTSTGLTPVRRISFPVMPAANLEDQIMSDAIVEPPVVPSGPKEITDPSQICSLRLPDTLLPVEVLKIVHYGGGILALAYNAVHKLWKWPKNGTQTANASVDVAPQLWQPSRGILMTNDIKDVKLEDTLACLAVSNNHGYAVSSSGGKISLFNLITFETITTFLAPPPAVTSLILHPVNNNMVIAGMLDGSIVVYNAKFSEVKQKLKGHQKCVTGLAFAVERNALISIGTDGQLCVWDAERWKMLTSQFIMFPATRTNNPQAPTRVYLNPAQTHFMVVHERQIAVFDTLNMDSCIKWAPQATSGAITDAVYSCDGESIFVCVEDGSVCIVAANTVELKCRISCAAYMPSKRSAVRVRPNSISAHPSKVNQFSLGLSNGAVFVIEPLRSNKQWGDEPPPTNTNPSLHQAMLVD